MRDQTLFFQGHWNWLIVVLDLVVCSHSPFLNVWMLSLRASLCLAVWMKCSAWAFREHPIGSICYMFPHIGQPHEQPTPSQTEGWNQALVRSAGKLLPLSWGLAEHRDSKGLTLCRSSFTGADGVSPEDASAAAEGRQVRKDSSSAISKGAFALERFTALEGTGTESWQGAWRWSQPWVKYRLLGP